MSLFCSVIAPVLAQTYSPSNCYVNNQCTNPLPWGGGDYLDGYDDESDVGFPNNFNSAGSYHVLKTYQHACYSPYWFAEWGGASYCDQVAVAGKYRTSDMRACNNRGGVFIAVQPLFGETLVRCSADNWGKQLSETSEWCGFRWRVTAVGAPPNEQQGIAMDVLPNDPIMNLLRADSAVNLPSLPLSYNSAYGVWFDQLTCEYQVYPKNPNLSAIIRLLRRPIIYFQTKKFFER